MTTYQINSIDVIAGMTTVSILGKGIGLMNNLKVTDENKNEFIIKSIAMTNKINSALSETILVIKPTHQIRPIGKNLFLL